MTSANLTRRALSLGNRDPLTGLSAKVWTETTVKGSIQNAGSTSLAGLWAKYPCTGIFPGPMYVDDEVKDLNNFYFTVKTSEHVSQLDNHVGYVCKLEKNELHFDRQSTIGTMHLDSESLRTDPRYRTKDWLDDYISDANITKDDGAAEASWVIITEKPDYSLKREFQDKNVDVIGYIVNVDSKPMYNHVHYLYAFNESVTIRFCAVNKTEITAANVLEKFEQEIRHVQSDYPLGSIRNISSIKDNDEDLGGLTMRCRLVTLEYTRVNDDYTPTYPAFDYGIAFIYEGDHTEDGSEGDWTLTQGAGSTCTQTVTSDNNLYLDQTVFSADSSTVNGTNLALSSTVYGKIRIRYKTSGAATAKVVLGFSSGTQIVLAESASTTFTVVDVAITTAKTINTITLYACDGVGTVTYDFVEIYAGTYILPNCTLIEPPVMVNDAVTDIPERVGSDDQPLGSQSMEVTMEADLDMEPAALTWKRPQTTTPKTDYNNQDVLTELHHRGSFYENWTWLDLGNPAMQFKARLIKLRPSYSDEAGRVRMVWREYRHGSASGETASERFGLTL